MRISRKWNLFDHVHLEQQSSYNILTQFFLSATMELVQCFTNSPYRSVKLRHGRNASRNIGSLQGQLGEGIPHHQRDQAVTQFSETCAKGGLDFFFFCQLKKLPYRTLRTQQGWKPFLSSFIKATGRSCVMHKNTMLLKKSESKLPFPLLQIIILHHKIKATTRQLHLQDIDKAHILQQILSKEQKRKLQFSGSYITYCYFSALNV